MNMEKIISLILISVTTLTIGFSQECDCESNFYWVKNTFEENDAGFQYVIDQKGVPAYEVHNSEIYNKIKKVKSDDECMEIIYEWLKFFRSGHISISKIQNQNNNSQSVSISQSQTVIDWETVKIDQKEFEKYLSAKKEADLEGIWEIPSYVIGIKKFKDEYKGFIVTSDAENWRPFELKLRINADQKSGTFYMRDKSSVEFSKVVFIGKSYVQLGNNFNLRRISPEFETDKDTETYIKSVSSQRPYLEQLNPTTLLLRIPSFNSYQKHDIDSVILANKSKLENTENLIIDLRNNSGGSDRSYAEILPYIYTNPFRIVNTIFYSTRLNNQRMLDFYENYEKYGIPEEDREEYKKTYEMLNENLGQFVFLEGGLEGKIIRERKLDKILPYPENVGIIINSQNGSTTEQFLLAAKQSKKVKLFGTTTMGVLDFSNMYFVNSPCNEFRLGYALSKSLRIPDMTVDGKGIQPDYYIDKSIPAHKWINFVSETLNEE
jgi:hypothetical protein